jgi:crossover junction endonuclease MUS81
MDGRYEEQKFRLKHCGINNVIYLVEGTPGPYCKIPETVLKKAQIHTQIFHGFNVLRIETMSDTLRWLTQMTRVIS